MIRRIGRTVLNLPTKAADVLAYVGGVSLLLLGTVRAIPGALLGRRARLGRAGLFEQMMRVGVNSIPVVFIVSIFIGVILALQTGPELRRFGAEAEAARITALGVLRELGPLISSLILAGYAGAAIAAELGTMRVGEELDALEAGAIDPVRFLVVPRVTATVVMVTVLAVFADWMGLVGGFLTAVFVMHLDAGDFIARVVNTVRPADFLTGVMKATSFGAIIALVACHEGMGVKMSEGAEGVGKATTRTVVRAGVLIIASDCLFTAAFYALGLI